MPKRVTAIFNAGKSEANELLVANNIAGAMVRTLGKRVAIQHTSLDTMGEQGVEDACIAARWPLEVVIMARDFRDGHNYSSHVETKAIAAR